MTTGVMAICIFTISMRRNIMNECCLSHRFHHNTSPSTKGDVAILLFPEAEASKVDLSTMSL